MSRSTRLAAGSLLSASIVLACAAVFSRQQSVVARTSIAWTSAARSVRTATELTEPCGCGPHPRDPVTWTARTTLRGNCTDEQGAAIDGRDVSMRLLGPTREVVAVPVRADGTFTAPLFELGTWRVECRAPGFHHTPVEVDVREQETRLAVVLEREATYDVVLLDAGGAPLADALDPAARALQDEFTVRQRGVAWQRFERSPLFQGGVPASLTVPAKTDLDVEVTFAGSPIDAVTRVSDLGVIEARVALGEIATRIVRIDFCIQEAPSQRPLADAFVSLTAPDRPPRGVRTDARGRASLCAISGGRLVVECAGHARLERVLATPLAPRAAEGVLELSLALVHAEL